MEIIVGKTAGFCYGVKRAVEGTKEQLKNRKKEIACLGEIVHNKEVVMALEKMGLKIIETLEEGKEEVIIRAHGVPKEVYQKAEEQKIKLKDFTCPNVLKIHKIAEEYRKKGFYIFLIGAADHPENMGTISHCGKESSIIEKPEDTKKALEQFTMSKKNKLLVISQTTYRMKNFKEIEEIIQQNIKQTTELVVRNTICHATEVRQKETESLAKQVDIMIIVGGKNSSNTKKLDEIAKKNAPITYCIETKKELEKEREIIVVQNKIGIMAGASTPQESIEEIVTWLEKIDKTKELN